MAAVPLRAGGGSRIKILEAFAVGVPVVATTAGAAGLEVEDRRHLLVADTPEAFASCCARIANDRQLARQLVDEAAQLIQQTYRADAVAHRLGAVLDALEASAR